ncbi:PorP/SprF family type IX secretion system membrane protein [Pedobacter arcticus]|uniref:PorP/SprF family type IX secretion system membrane protein n=1 Tax=Pedobacter arcticus TaxID=752140 RepID=UPI00047517C5|nr:type IX secretion system membrane protein PorP/SprF [Pedobacter arcticus]
MKRFTLLFLLLANSIFAQQRPYYTQYLQNMEIINPALTGMYKAVNVKMGFRNQWIGIKDAPKTAYLTASIPLNLDGSPLIAGSADYGIEEPYTRSDKDSYYSSDNHHGIGLSFINDNTGPINRTTANLTYAYHLLLGDIANLSFGVGAGMSRIGLNTTGLVFEDPNDPVVTNGEIINWTPDVNLGFYLYGSQFFFGGSIQQVVKEKLSFNDISDKSAEVSHYFLTGGYRFFVGEDISFTPSIMAKYVAPFPLSYDLNLKVAFRNNFWIGGSFRKKDAFSVLAGFSINKMLDAGYAFDHSISTIKTITSGSHEFVLGIKF